MDPLLASIIVLVVFSLLIFLIGRSARWFALVGGAVAAYLVLRWLGVI